MITIDKSYYCEGCGGVMEFDPVSQKLKCPNCGTEFEIPNNIEDIVEHDLTTHAMNSVCIKEKKSKSMECEGCGALVEVDETSTATTCPYCGSNYVLASKQTDAIIPDGVIPFKVDKKDVGQIFNNWIKKRWLAPNVLKTLYQQDKVQGIYIPYWTFDADTNTNYTAMGGIDYEVEYENSEGETETRTETNWYPVFGNINHFFDDVLVSASNKLDRDLLECIEPEDTKEIVSYSPDYMSGYSSEIYTINLEDAHEEATEKMKDDIRYMAETEVLRKYDRVKNIILNVSYQNESYKHIFMPVYATAYMYKDKKYNVLINGQTGVVDGEYPKSVVKIIAIVVVILVIVFGIYYFTSK